MNQEDNRKVVIRFTEESDLKQLPWLYRQYHNGDTHLETDIDGMYKKFSELKQNDNYKFVSAVDGDKLVGFCSVVINQDIVERQKPIIMLWNLRVHPEYRGQGIGSQIMKFIEDFGKEKGVDFIFLGCDADNQSARKFYKKLGYGEDYGFYKYL